MTLVHLGFPQLQTEVTFISKGRLLGTVEETGILSNVSNGKAGLSNVIDPLVHKNKLL